VALDTIGDVTVEFRRVPCDILAVASAVRRSELPDRFATDLEVGGGRSGPLVHDREAKC
jgi:hypothetical protein